MIGKVVYDMIFARKEEAITEVEKTMYAKFDVGSISSGADVVFTRLFIQQHPDFLITANMDEFLTTMEPISLPHSGKKEDNCLYTSQELKLCQILKRKLNFLGQGVLP